MEGDAWLGARVIRVYARDWLHAAGRFAALVLPYLAEDAEKDAALRELHDARGAAGGADHRVAQTVEADEEHGSADRGPARPSPCPLELEPVLAFVKKLECDSMDMVLLLSLVASPEE